ncbi:hypothetical protein K2173_027431 [Erythroxylum novogranatense]|uniref:RING-type E3 ubiquitin transferase n=1 Tax=Erythroxylum novogranatense TaxID=1862640 RepID=A0AAV8U214_9ROSI|nr:hypothetical protein K2173_027431 [Erythroxylum novogranatense]
MGTGWRRAFCTTIPRDRETTTVSDKQQTSPSASPSPRSCTKLAFLSVGSNPTTPRQHSQLASSPSLRCRTTSAGADPVVRESPILHCKTTPRATKSPKTSLLGSNPSSPRSPLKLALFRNSFKFRSSCGICLNSVKTGQGTAIYTAECAHAFHFPCIASHCHLKDVPLLAVHKNLHPENDSQTHDGGNNTVAPTTNTNNNNGNKPKIDEKKVVLVESSPIAIKTTKQQPLTPKSSDSRSYDDDEPLLSPTARGMFVPIPEADENVEGNDDDDDDDDEEFQGFLVNPIPSSSIKSNEVTINSFDSRNVQVRLLPEAAVVSASRGYQTYAVALRVKAPPPAQPVRGNTAAPLLDPSQRAPIDLVTVLDVSGSMTGAKLQMLKRAMRLVISSLGSADRLSVVAFSGIPKRLLPLKRMTAHGQRTARRIVDRLKCGQGTCVGDALRKATKVLEDRRERNPVASIMLLSDGQDERVQSNAYTQQRASSHASSTRFAHIEIPVHSFGFGQSAGYSHEPAEDAFAKCVGGLLSVVVQDLRIQLNLASGSAPAEITAVYACNARPTVLRSGSVRLGDLYAEEERELLVELRVPSTATGSHQVLSVRCLYKDPATQEVVYGRDQALLAPRPHAVRSSEPKIERLRNHFIATRAVAEGRSLVDHGDFTSAHQLLVSSRGLIIQWSSTPRSADEYVKDGISAEKRWREEAASVVVTDENGEPLTPTSAWRAAEKLAKVAMMKKSLNRVSDLHGFENARF